MKRAVHAATNTWFDSEGRHVDQCTIKILDGLIRLEFDYGEPQLVIWDGHEREPGHFEIKCAVKKGEGTLHRFANESRLEGHWKEGGELGTWIIDIEEEDED